MKSILVLLLVAFLAAASAQTIVEKLAGEPLYSQVHQSLAGKPIETFLNETTITATLLAPKNEAPALNLTNNELSYHVVNGTKLNVSQVVDGELFLTALGPLASLNGGFQRVKASVNGTQLFVGPNKAEVNVTELEASNGAIYGLDRAITFPADLDTLVTSLGLTTLSTVLKAAGLQLNTTGATVFAPSDAAFTDLSTTSPLVFKYLTSGVGVADLKSVLELHVATRVVYSADIPVGTTTEPTLNGETVSLVRTATEVTVGNANGAAQVSTSGDQPASNGVAHVINKVLVPTGFTFNLGKAMAGLGLTSFADALREFNFTQFLDNTTPYTLFAPTNAALAGKTITAELLKYHIVAGAKTSFPAGLVQSELALASDNAAFQQHTVTIVGNNTVLDGVTLPAAQSAGANVGVIYVIDTVLPVPTKNIVATATDGGFSKFVSAVTLAGAAPSLAYTTVFAPVDAAFTGPVADYLLLNTNQSNADLLNVLNLHVAAGNNFYYVAGLPALPGTIVTRNAVENITVTVNGSTVHLNDKATVVKADVLAANGVIHGIDSVLIPSDFVLTTDKVVQGFKAGDFLGLLAKANLTYVLTGTETFTVFTFTDSAYDSAPQDLIDNPSKWPSVLKTHIYNGTIPALVAGTNYTMLSGEVLEVLSATSVQVRGAEEAGKPKILGGPIVTSNGVVYSIDGILSVKAAEKDDDGLSDTAIGFIVIGCIVGVLLIIGAAGGGYWYYRRRAGYEQIGDNAF
jgi:transforming growth factor-beta-induced protein